MAREALVLIPGLRWLERGVSRDRLLDALKQSETFQCAIQDEVDLGGYAGRRLTWIRRGEAAAHEVDVFEAHYGDLVPRLEDFAPLQRLRRGTGLIAFWVFSGAWKTLFYGNTYLSLWVLLSALLLGLWYVGLVVVGVAALGQLTFHPDNELVTSAATRLGDWGAGMARWPVWVAIAFVLSLLRVDALANLSHFAWLYLTDVETRGKVRRRPAEVLDWVLAGGRYERVTVAAHSFGVVVALDLLADLAGGKRPPVRLVTVGGPLTFLYALRTWVRGELDKLGQNRNVASWSDFYAESDYLSAKVQIDSGVLPYPFDDNDVGRMGGLLARLSGETHVKYWHEAAVADRLLVWPA